MKKRIDDGMARRNRSFRRRKDFYRQVYLNNGVRKDAVSFNLITDDALIGTLSFRDSFRRLLQKYLAVLFYLLYLVPFFSLYFLISYSGKSLGLFVKLISRSIKKAKRAIDENSMSRKKPLIYNP